MAARTNQHQQILDYSAFSVLIVEQCSTVQYSTVQYSNQYGVLNFKLVNFFSFTVWNQKAKK